MTLLFRPIGIVAGLVAGMIARRLFESSWSSLSDDEAPSAEQEAPGLGRLALALLLEGAIFSLVRGLVDHGARVAFQRYTGAWPGEKEEDR